MPASERTLTDAAVLVDYTRWGVIPEYLTDNWNYLSDPS